MGMQRLTTNQRRKLVTSNNYLLSYLQYYTDISLPSLGKTLHTLTLINPRNVQSNIVFKTLLHLAWPKIGLASFAHVLHSVIMKVILLFCQMIQHILHYL